MSNVKKTLKNRFRIDTIQKKAQHKNSLFNLFARLQSLSYLKQHKRAKDQDHLKL